MIPSGMAQRDERERTADDVSKAYRRCRNREKSLPRDESGGWPDCGPDDIRHEGGVTLGLALARNVGTCRPDAKGDAQMGCPRESKSTDAGHRDGAARSRVESSVMEPDRRGCVVQLSPEVNQQWEEPRG
jgi:hypothetical protein